MVSNWLREKTTALHVSLGLERMTQETEVDGLRLASNHMPKVLFGTSGFHVDRSGGCSLDDVEPPASVALNESGAGAECSHTGNRTTDL